MFRYLPTMHDICLPVLTRATNHLWVGDLWENVRSEVRGKPRLPILPAASPLSHLRQVCSRRAGGSFKHAWSHTCAQRRRQASMLSQVSESACPLHGGGCPGSSEITTSFFRPLEEPLQIGPEQTRLGSQRPWLDWTEGGQFPGIGDAAQCS